MRNRIKTLLFTLLLSLFSFLVFSQNYVGDSDSVNYRGKREPRDAGEFSVINIVSSRVDSENIRFDILFNQSIDPKSVESATFLVNGKTVFGKGKTEFSKDGKKIRIILGVSTSDFDFEVRGINSYSGKALNGFRRKLRDNGEVRLSSD